MLQCEPCDAQHFEQTTARLTLPSPKIGVLIGAGGQVLGTKPDEERIGWLH